MQFYFIEGIVDLAEELSRDKQALERLHMHRTTASYKMTLRKRWKVTLEQIEEAINNNQTRLLTILVSYYNEQSQLVIVEHLASLSVLAVNASSVFHAVKNEYEDLELPWKNVMSQFLWIHGMICEIQKADLKQRFEKTYHLNC